MRSSLPVGEMDEFELRLRICFLERQLMNPWSVSCCTHGRFQFSAQKEMAAKEQRKALRLLSPSRKPVDKNVHYHRGNRSSFAWFVIIPLLPDEKTV